MSKKKIRSKTKKELQKLLVQTKEKLKVLFQVTEEVSTLDLEIVLRRIVSITSKLTHADSCLIYLLSENKKELVLKASKNPHKRALGRITIRLGEGITGWVAREKIPVSISHNVSQDSRFKYFASLPEDRFEAFLSVPMLHKKKVVGVINIQHKKKHVYNNEVELLAAIGRIVGAAVENARLVDESMILKEALKTRKLLDKAKSILIKNGLSEETAHRRIQKYSMNSSKSIREVVEAIIITNQLNKK